MKRLTLFLTLLLTFALSIPAFAGKPDTKGNGIDNGDSGKHFQFNIIGSKNGIPETASDNSNGGTIFVPLHTVGSPNQLMCGDAQDNGGALLVDDTWPNYSSDVPDNNARINFVVCPDCTNFEISDRDAISDGNATILVPESMLDASTKGILFNVYIRVLGKPLQCMEINGYAYDGNYYYNSGTVYLSKKGKSTFMKVNDLFDVWYCDAYTDPDCTPTEISVFDDVFLNYFWEIYNDGTKLVQVRIYPQAL